MKIETTPGAWISVGAQTYHPPAITVQRETIKLKKPERSEPDEVPVVVLSFGPSYTSFVALGLREATALGVMLAALSEEEEG